MSSMQQHARPSSSSSSLQHQPQHQQQQQQQQQHYQQQQQPSAKKPGLLLPPHSPCRLSSEAYRGKIDWEAKYRKPCPYARPAGEGCPYVRRSARTCFSDQTNDDNDAQAEGSSSRGLLVSVPGAPHRDDFGSGFSREIDDPACRESSPRVEREPEVGEGTGAAAAAGATAGGSVRRGAAAAAAAAAASSPKKRKNDKNKSSARNNNNNINKNTGVRKKVPTLLKIHQRVIEDALLELTRSREEAFENLGERLGGEHEDFTFYDGTFNFAAGLPARLPACAAQRRKFARNRRKLHQRMRGQPNTIKGARHRAQTDHAYRGVPLPRFKKDQEAWKIPLLRVATPTNGERQDSISDDTTFGKIVRLGSHPQHSSSSSSAAAGAAVQNSQNCPGRYSASCPPRKVRKDASGGRKHPRTVEGSGKRGRRGGGGGGSRSDVENGPSERDLPDVEPSSDSALPTEEIVEQGDQQHSLLLATTARDEVSGQGQHEKSCGINAAETTAAAAASCTGDGGPRDTTTQSADDAIGAGPTAATTTAAHAETAWSGETPTAEAEMSGSVRVRAEKYVDEIVSQGMRTHLAVAASSGGVSAAAGSRTLPTSSAEAGGDARSEEKAVVAGSEAHASAEQYVDEVLSQYLRTQPVSDLTIETTGVRSRLEAADAGPERCAIQEDAAPVSAVQSGAVGSGNLKVEAFSEEFLSDVLQVHEAIDEEIRRSSPSTAAAAVERDCARSEQTATVGVVQPSVFEQVVSDAVRQSLHAAVVAALCEQCLESSITADDGLDAPPARLAEASPVEAANSAETLDLSATSATSEGGIGLTPLHGTNVGKEERPEEQDAHSGVAAKELPVGFLDAIVAGRASLKPTAAAAATTSRSASAKPSPSELQLQKETMEADAKQRAAVLCEFEDLVRTERLDRYAPESFSRGVVRGEGKQSVVYCAGAISRADARQRSGGEEQRQDPHQVGAVVGGGVVAAATAAMADIVTTAAVGAIMATTTTTTKASDDAAERASNVLAAGVVISVMAASVSSVAARKLREHDNNTRLASFAAKEFRYTRQDAPVSILRDARREVCAHLCVAGCAHVVALRGVWLTPRVTLLLEPMNGGNLHDFIHYHHNNSNPEETRPLGKGVGGHHGRDGLTPAGTAWLLAGVADGLAALHDAGVVHRDVKSHNVMMMMLRRQHRPIIDDEDDELVGNDDVLGHSNKCEKGTEKDARGKPEWEAKLGDLGSAARVPTQEGRTALTEEAGTSGWVAPEVFGDEGYGTAADIFSLGVLIWEAFTRGALDNPLSGLSGQACRTKLREGLRPPWPPQAAADAGVKGLVERCWAFEAGDRPRAGAVADELRAFAAAAGGGGGGGGGAQPLAST